MSKGVAEIAFGVSELVRTRLQPVTADHLWHGAEGEIDEHIIEFKMREGLCE